MATEVIMGLDERQIQSIIGSLDLDEVRQVTDIGGQSLECAIRLHQRYGCPITIVCLDEAGKRSDAVPDRINRYLATLSNAGITKDAVRVVTAKDALDPSDVILCLNGFGARFNIRKSKAIFKTLLHSNSRVVVEIKKNSGAYPFLNTYGSCNTIDLASASQNGLVVMSVEPRSEPSGEWSKIAQNLKTENGFFSDLGEHSFLYIPSGNTLVVTFDNLDIAMTKRTDRRPWGFDFIQTQGWSMLGVMANGWTWFRGAEVSEKFIQLRDSGFFAAFENVVFYGASMGGYAAAAYAAVVEESTVFVISPQSTLDRALVPWETRYKKAWARDFSGPFGDAAITSQNVKRVHIMFDPYVTLDAAHAERFSGGNVTFWRCPLMGHRLGSSLAQMGILGEISRRMIAGDMSASDFNRLLRRRHTFARFQRELANLALDRNHPGLARQVCEFVLRERQDPYFQKMLDRL